MTPTPAARTGAPVAGNDMKTGQTLIKTIIAPSLKARMIGVHGWYSTNILGNRDGEVLDHPESFKTKEQAMLSDEELQKICCRILRKVRLMSRARCNPGRRKMGPTST